MSVNLVMLTGKAGKDPEIFNGQKTKVAKFSLATTEYAGKQNGQAQYETEWHEIVVFGATADFLERNVRKGDSVAVIGRIKTESWDDKQSGQKRSKKTIVVGMNGKVEKIGSSRNSGGNGAGNGNGGGQGYGNNSYGNSNDFDQAPADEDIPF